MSQWGCLRANGPVLLEGGDPSLIVDWAAQGFETAEQYRVWSANSCGVACLQSVLGGLGVVLPPKAALIDELMAAGAYRVQDDRIVGLIYDPCVKWIGERWGLDAVTARHLTTGQLRGLVREGHLVIASVSAEIRSPQKAPTRRGGHLVLVFDGDGDGDDGDGTVRLHNPSGFPADQAPDGIESARDVRVPLERFEAVFAHRGIVIGPPPG